jgi:hypothetical protein
MPRSVRPAAGFKRMNLNIEAGLLDAFKAAAALQGKEMTAIVIEFIESYVREKLPGGRPPKRTPRRT